MSPGSTVSDGNAGVAAKVAVLTPGNVSPDIPPAPQPRAAPVRVLLMVTELEDYTIAFANGLARHADVILAVPRRRYASLITWLDPRIDLRLLDWPRHRDLRNAQLLVELTRLIRLEKPSVIHLLSNNTLWLNFAAPFWRRVPMITTVHDLDTHPGDRDTRRLPAWASVLMARQSRDLIVHGETLRQGAIARFAKKAEHVHSLPHPAIHRYAEVARRENMFRQRIDGRFKVLLFGRIFAYKGLSDLIQAEVLLGTRIAGLRIVIAGRGDDPRLYRNAMGDETRYEIHPHFLDDKAVARAFLQADLIVLPYTEASQSGVLNIAATFGKPMVVTDVGELGATIRSAHMGLVVPPNRPNCLASAIAALHDDPEMRAEMGRNALVWASGINSPDTVGAQAVALYRALIRRKQS